MKWIAQVFSRRRYLTLDEAVTAFIDSPSQWFYYRGQPYIWPMPIPGMQGDIYFDNIRVLVDGHSLGLVEGLTIRGRSAYIAHIAVENKLIRRGIGSALAHGLALELVAQYGVDRIVFTENHPQFHASGYPAFFEYLGAQAVVPDHPAPMPDRPDYEWLLMRRDFSYW